jgi:hypothetical protein
LAPIAQQLVVDRLHLDATVFDYEGIGSGDRGKAVRSRTPDQKRIGPIHLLCEVLKAGAGQLFGQPLCGHAKRVVTPLIGICSKQRDILSIVAAEICLKIARQPEPEMILKDFDGFYASSQIRAVVNSTVAMI